MKTLLKQFKVRPLITTFLMLCLILSTLSVSIINSIISKEEQSMREENFGINYSKTLNYIISPNNHSAYSNTPKSIADLIKNKYWKKYETSFKVQSTVDTMDFTVDIANVKYNYLDKISVLKVLDTSDMKNSVAMGMILYEKLGRPKTINISKREYKISHILGSRIDSTPFEDDVVLNYKILNEKDKENILLDENVSTITFLNVKNANKENQNIKVSFNGAHDEGNELKTDFQICKAGDEDNQNELKRAYEMQKYNLSNKSMLLIIGMCNIVIVSTFWIIDRKKEIAIRKAFGANKKQISFLIFKELFILAFTSSIIAIILQCLFKAIGGKFFDFGLKPSVSDLIIVCIGAFIISVISSIIPVRNALKMEISQCLKG